MPEQANTPVKGFDYAAAVRRFERVCPCVWVGNRRVRAYRIAGTPEAGYHAMLCAYRARQHAESSESEMHTYRIGSTLVSMTANQANAWNEGNITAEALDGATVDAIVDIPELNIERGRVYPLYQWIGGVGDWPDHARDMEGERAFRVATVGIGGAA